MLAQHMAQLTKDYGLEENSLQAGEPGTYALPLEQDLILHIVAIPDEGYLMKADIAPLPKERVEQFVTQMMLANLFGQGTEEAVLGLNPTGETIRMTHPVNYKVDYQRFKGMLDQFIKVIDFWRAEAAKK